MKKIIALFLCTVLILSMAVTASATILSISCFATDISSSGLVFDITVPMSLLIAVDDTGKVSVADNFTISNNSI